MYFKSLIDIIFVRLNELIKKKINWNIFIKIVLFAKYLVYDLIPKNLINKIIKSNVYM